jgi:hypothetical protein
VATPGPFAVRGPSRWPADGGGRGALIGGQTGSMQNSQPSGAKGFAVLVGVMVVIVLALMAIAVLLSPHH